MAMCRALAMCSALDPLDNSTAEIPQVSQTALTTSSFVIFLLLDFSPPLDILTQLIDGHKDCVNAGGRVILVRL